MEFRDWSIAFGAQALGIYQVHAFEHLEKITRQHRIRREKAHFSADLAKSLPTTMTQFSSAHSAQRKDCDD